MFGQFTAVCKRTDSDLSQAVSFLHRTNSEALYVFLATRSTFLGVASLQENIGYPLKGTDTCALDVHYKEGASGPPSVPDFHK